jgi:Rieske Fe-S protein
MRRLSMLPLPAPPDDADDPCITRRAILATLAAAALSACSSSSTVNEPMADSGVPPTDSGGGVDSGMDPGCGATNAGAVSTYPQGTWKAMGGFIVGHDAMGLFAFSTTCTHRGCTVLPPTPSTGETTCPCHGAQYDGNGAVTKGPATDPLPHYKLTVCSGTVFVDQTATVPATTRTAAA